MENEKVLALDNIEAKTVERKKVKLKEKQYLPRSKESDYRK